eukprot:3314150-Pleurochrysis_carterae.AAC.1
MRRRVPDRDKDALRFAEILRVCARKREVVGRVERDGGVEGGEAFQARVAEAPAVVLPAVEDVDVAAGREGDGRERARLGVVVERLDDQARRANGRSAEPGVPRRAQLAALA